MPRRWLPTIGGTPDSEVGSPVFGTRQFISPCW